MENISKEPKIDVFEQLQALFESEKDKSGHIIEPIVSSEYFHTTYNNYPDKSAK